MKIERFDSKSNRHTRGTDSWGTFIVICTTPIVYQYYNFDFSPKNKISILAAYRHGLHARRESQEMKLRSEIMSYA